MQMLGDITSVEVSDLQVGKRAYSVEDFGYLLSHLLLLPWLRVLTTRLRFHDAEL